MVLKIIIVGGGIGGLAAAAGLARAGHNVTVYERSKTSGGVGFAFRVTENSNRCLRDLDIDVIAGGACAADGVIHHNAQGEVLHKIKENTDLKAQGGAASVFAYRPQILQQLWDAALKNGATIKPGIKVVDVDAVNTRITLEDGSITEADLIIGADGARSIVRQKVVDAGEYFPKATLEQNAFRFMVPIEAISKDELLAPMYTEGSYNLSWESNGKRLLAYAVDFGKQVNIVCTHPQHLSDRKAAVASADSDARIDYDEKVPADVAIGIHEDFDPRAKRFLELADPNGFRTWKLMDMETLPNWSRNKTVLLGDCCHLALPFGFSGASMALEDASVLYTLLPRETQPSQLSIRLDLFESIRKPRVNRVRDTSRMIGKGNVTREILLDYVKFLKGFNVIEDARTHLAAL